MRIINDTKLDFKDVLILPKRSQLKSRKEVDLERTFIFKNTIDPNTNSPMTWSGVPIMVANMDTTGTFEMANALMKHKIITCIHKHYSVNDWKKFLSKLCPSDFNYFTVSIGITDNDMNKLNDILELNDNIKFICIDVANGYTEMFIDRVKEIKTLYPSKVLIAGNIVTPEITEELILSGVDIVKAGIGGGSVCTTRIKTGVGYPQMSTVIECSDAAHGLKGHVISDGGCTNSGDISKAFGGGADFVMMGGIFSGHDESSGDLIEQDGIKYKEFYGMSSSTAMEKHNGGVKSYKASEGKRVLVKYKGPVDNTVNDILGGIRSTCTYVGAIKLKELSKRTTFVKVTQQSNEVYSKNS
uniref:GMP reductase n=1 Tax=Megaviridae environmental sample TaxID=1737588 RepID=A0A5J6VKF2_9VIRU|nr:MAG: IMP dehydrogenase / GMP reductase domain protein [Megaviridae environmental sample]